MTYVPNVLFLAWRDAKSRRIIPVGRLLRLPDVFEFAFIGSVKRSQESCFLPLVTFPSLHEVYRSSQLPPLFSNRLMSTSRSDFADHVNRLALRVDEAEPFTVLARSAGRRETDKLEVFSPPELVGDKAMGFFLARGVRHIDGAEDAIERLVQQAALHVIADRDNPVTAAALVLENDGAQRLGFVPDYLAQELASNKCPSDLLKVSVAQVNPRPAPLHHRLVCRFEYEDPAAHVFFAGSEYQPLSNSATPTSATAAA